MKKTKTKIYRIWSHREARKLRRVAAALTELIFRETPFQKFMREQVELEGGNYYEEILRYDEKTADN